MLQLQLNVTSGIFAPISLCAPQSKSTLLQGGGAYSNRFLEELMPVARSSTETLNKLLASWWAGFRTRLVNAKIRAIWQRGGRVEGWSG